MKFVEIMRKLWKPKRGHGSCGNHKDVVEAKKKSFVEEKKSQKEVMEVVEIMRNLWKRKRAVEVVEIRRNSFLKLLARKFTLLNFL